MLRGLVRSAFCCGATAGMATSASEWKQAKTIYEFSADLITGKNKELKDYTGDVCVVVNVATKWGLTDLNYRQFVSLYDKYEKDGLRILAFPCNQFGHQEPGTNAEIAKFAAGYGVKFDMYSKIDVNGDDAHPLWKFLKSKQGGALGMDFIKWNFTKFLVDRDGVPIKRFGPKESPDSMEADIKKCLGNV